MRICIIEDEKITLSILEGVLRKAMRHDITGFSDPREAMAACDAAPFDLVLVDYQMPGMDGVEFVSLLREKPAYETVPVVMITADRNRDIRLAAIRAGTTDFLQKPVDPEELTVRAANLLSLRSAQLSLASRARHLAEEVRKATAKIEEREEEVILRLSRAIGLRDGETGDHIERVAAVSRIIAARLDLSDAEIRNIYLAAPLHDIGKIGITDAILNKNGRLTPEEIAVMREHTTLGGDILGDATNDLLCTARKIALTHHEKWDGTGYPKGLVGTDIPLPGRVVAVADVFDALCSARAYKPAWTLEDARAEVRALSGSQFDPACVQAFEDGWPEIRHIYTRASQVDAA